MSAAHCGCAPNESIVLICQPIAQKQSELSSNAVIQFIWIYFCWLVNARLTKGLSACCHKQAVRFKHMGDFFCRLVVDNGTLGHILLGCTFLHLYLQVEL